MVVVENSRGWLKCKVGRVSTACGQFGQAAVTAAIAAVAATGILCKQVNAGAMPAPDLTKLVTPTYTTDGHSFTRTNGERFNNRPLYCNQIPAAVLGGDRPYLRLGQGSYQHGSLLIGLRRGAASKWAHDCDQIVMKYFPGRLEWTVADSSFGGTSISIVAYPAAEGAGMAVRVEVRNAAEGDEIVWGYGASAKTERQPFLWDWDVTTGGREKLLTVGFVPSTAAGNSAVIREGGFELTSADGEEIAHSFGRANWSDEIKVGDAGSWASPGSLLASSATSSPMIVGRAGVRGGRAWHIAIDGRVAKPGAAAKASTLSAEEAYLAAEARAAKIASRIEIESPDPWLNAAIRANLTVTDGVFRNGVFTHAGMRWGVPLVGWRTMYGGTIFGWHDRVKQQVKLFTDNQLKESDKLIPEADPKLKLTRQSANSRMFGKGRVTIYHPLHYNMQSQFFDQAIHAWRWTGDAELAAMLRPALELHTEYLRECFDPDGDGVYETYTNTWPTDHTWFSGGGTSEETAYAFAAHKAARDLAKLAADENAALRHQKHMDHIHRGFLEKMWSQKSGHPGAVREQLGHQRLREDAWLYSIFCPIDAGMLTPLQSFQALHYTEWALQRLDMPYGGQQVWPSNWVPNIWSVREMWPGDNYHLALAYFQSGLAEDGWRVLRGTFPEYLLFGPVPGDQGHGAGGTDFNDCAGMFGRVVVEGLFGIRPDVPNNIVVVSPQLPEGWPRASIRTPDYYLAVSRGAGEIVYEFSQAGSTQVRLEVPVEASEVLAVKLNGVDVPFELGAMPGRTTVKVTSGTSRKSCKLIVSFVPSAAPKPTVAMQVKSGQVFKLGLTPGEAKTTQDPQSALILQDGTDEAVVANGSGHRLVVSERQEGKLPQLQVLKLKVIDEQAELAGKTRVLSTVPDGASWHHVDLERIFNGDIRTIFQQEYLSPRPNTCSLRVGTDGYGIWQMVLQKDYKPPAIDLTKLDSLDRGNGTISAAGAAFTRPGETKNVAFTSLWDNWPDQVDVPVGMSGDAVYFLICGATYPMHTRIANAVLVLNYADGTTDRLDLIPPLNFWSLCHYGKADYNYKRDWFPLSPEPPAQVLLGNNCRAMVLNLRMKPGVRLESIRLEALSPEVIVGLMGVSVMNPK